MIQREGHISRKLEHGAIGRAEVWAAIAVTANLDDPPRGFQPTGNVHEHQPAILALTGERRGHGCGRVDDKEIPRIEHLRKVSEAAM
jgi:hypothetical protein